jgi:hypothetical protein
MVHNEQHKQLGDGLANLNEILTVVAPPMINIQQQFGEGAGYFNLEQEIKENPIAKE